MKWIKPHYLPASSNSRPGCTWPKGREGIAATLWSLSPLKGHDGKMKTRMNKIAQEHTDILCLLEWSLWLCWGLNWLCWKPLDLLSLLLSLVSFYSLPSWCHCSCFPWYFVNPNLQDMDCPSDNLPFLRDYIKMTRDVTTWTSICNKGPCFSVFSRRYFQQIP